MSKINICFDIKVLIDAFFTKSGYRAGVYFVAWNVLNIMQKSKKFHITLTYPIEYAKSNLLKKIKIEPFFSQFKFACSGIDHELSQIECKIEKHKNNKCFAKMLYNYLRLIKLKIKEKLYYNEKNFKKVQIYLSPFYTIPEVILKQKHIEKIYILYDTIPVMFSEYFSCNLGYNRMLTSLNKSAYSFCISQSCKDDFLRYCGDKLDANRMFVTYIATNQDYTPNYNKQELVQILKKYNVEHRPSDKYLFSLCTLEPRKNLPFTIACFFKFIKKHNIQDLYFYLGGGAWKTLEDIIVKTLDDAGNFKHKIKLLGYVDDMDINILYSNSLFFTYLSQYEGFGMPPLEAMQAGTPVITSNNSSLPEVVGDAAITLTYDDEQAVIKAFEDFYFNEDLRKEYIAKGLERAKMFSW